MNEAKLFRSANYVRTELTIRLAHRIRDFQKLPFIVGTNPHIENVYRLYWDAFEIIRQIPVITDLEANDLFVKQLKDLLARHLVVIPKLALGMTECKEAMGGDAKVDAFMTKLIASRISRRVLAEQHIRLSANFGIESAEDYSFADGAPSNWRVGMGSYSTSGLEYPKDSWIGIVNTRVNASKTVEKCARLAVNAVINEFRVEEEGNGNDENKVKRKRKSKKEDSGNETDSDNAIKFQVNIRTSDPSISTTLSETISTPLAAPIPEHSESPVTIEIDGHVNAEFTYIPDHIEYMLFEILKNAIRHTLLQHEFDGPSSSSSSSTARTSPLTKVTISESDTDVLFRISDEGGGIDPELLPNLFSFSHTCNTALQKLPVFAGKVSETLPYFGKKETSSGLLRSHLGLGLPMCRVYANYWGGNISVFSLDGYGTDVYVRIAKLGNVLENLDSNF